MYDATISNCDSNDMAEYLGFKEIRLTDDEVNDFFRDKFDDTLGLLENEYVIIEDAAGNRIALMKLSNGKLVKVPFTVINSKFSGKVKPRNVQQEMVADMLFDSRTTIKMISGRYGCGKDYLMCAAAVEMLEKGEYDKIVYVRNNIEVKDSKPIGYLPGSGNDKLLPFAMPLADHLGGIDGLRMFIEDGKIEIAHLGFMRGRDIKHSIIMVSEGENLTKEHIQLLIGRVSEGSALWINGDFKQHDARVFESNNGMIIARNKLKGHQRFGYVKLLKTERSETAAMADLLD